MNSSVDGAATLHLDRLSEELRHAFDPAMNESEK